MSLDLKLVAGRDSTVCEPEWQSQGEQGVQCSGPEVVPTGMQAKLSEGCLITSMPSDSVLSGLEMAGVEGLGGLSIQGIDSLRTRGCKEGIWLDLCLS